MNLFPSQAKQSNPGKTAFTCLVSEDEPWLLDCFVPPPEFESISGDRSCIILGDSGSGKTAIFRALRACCVNANGGPGRLIVDWQNLPLLPDDSRAIDSTWANRQSIQLVDACAMTLAAYLANDPRRFAEAPGWVQDRLIWFLHRGINGNVSNRLSPLAEEYSDEGLKLINNILQSPINEIYANPSPKQLIDELSRIVKRVGINGIWVLGDGLEPDMTVEKERLGLSLMSFLSVLDLFERSSLVFKFCLPADLYPWVSRATGVERRRIDVFKLKWDPQSLTQLLEKRLALVLQQPGFTLDDLCNDSRLKEWLIWSGGQTPRQWIEQVEPYISYYLEKHLASPISSSEWVYLHGHHPPRVWMDESGYRFKVAGREISLDDLPPSAIKVLRYLMAHPNRMIPREELYFKGCLDMSAIPLKADPAYQSPNDYKGMLDTIIYRLRQTLEPDPKQPIILQTNRGYGYMLVSHW